MDYSKMSDQELLALHKRGQQANPQTQQFQQLQPRRGAAQLIGDFMTRLGGGTPTEKSGIDEAIKYQNLLTGSPEFKMQEAQTRANMDIQKGLDLDQAKRNAAVSRYNAAAEASGQQTTGVPQQGGPQAQPVGSTQQPGQDTPRYITVNTKEYDPNLGMFIDKPTIKDNPEWEALYKPLSGDQPTKFAGATQGRQSVQDILQMLKLTPTGGTRNGQPEYKSGFGPVKRTFMKMGQEAAETDVGNVPIIGPILNPSVKNVAGLFAGQDVRAIGNEYMTLAEDLLRARTGAAAPEPEIVRELARTLNRFGDDPTTVANRLLNDQEFLDSVIEGIRPGWLAKFGNTQQVQQPTQQGQPQAGGMFNGEEILEVKQIG